MKKYLLLVLTVLFFTVSASDALAARTASASATPAEAASTSLLSQINNLKDKIASKVASLKLVEKRGIIGTVTEASGTQITINDIQNQTRFIDVDEITKFTSPDKKANFGISDISKDMTISVLGLYNKDSRRILARFVDVVDLPIYISGTVTNIDKTNYTVTVETADKQQEVVDIEAYSKINSYSVDDPTTPTRSGFSKMAVNEKVLVIGTPNQKEKNRASADRILVFPDFGGSAQPLEASPTGDLTPTKGSAKTTTPTGKKITPTQIP